MLRKISLAALAFVASTHFALAQVSNGRVTTSAPTYSSGTAAPLSLTTAGALRTSNAPSGTQDVNLTQIQGAAPSATNPLWVSPATASTPWVVGGNAASGAADSGNPVKSGGVYNTTNPTLINGQRGDTQMDARANTEVTPCGFGTTNCAAVQAPASDGISSTATLGLATSAYPYVFNGTTFDRLRGSTSGMFNVIRDAAGNARGANVNASNQLSVSVDNTPTVNTASGYPNAATAETASATGTTLATAATLAASVGKTTYICGFSIRANATAAATGNSTVAGTITGTLNFTQWTAPLASGIGITEMIFTPCVPASTTNTTIVVTSAAPGSGGTVSVSAWGYQQ